jgi:hypothetical protein
VADLDGDGLPDLFYTHTPVKRQGARASLRSAQQSQLRAIRGVPPVAWRWLGTWEPGQDVDGDGVPEMVHRQEDSRLAMVSGRTGRLLWPALPGYRSGKGSVPHATAEPPRSLAGDTVLAPPVPVGDLAGAGRPDLLVVDSSRRPEKPEEVSKVLLPLRAVSGLTGKTLWTAQPFREEGNRHVDVGLPEVIDPGEGSGAIVLVSCRTPGNHGDMPWLAALSARDGWLRWKQPLAAGSTNRTVRPFPLAVTLADLADRGKALIHLVPIAKPASNEWGFRLCARLAQDGTVVWERPLELSRTRLAPHLPAPVIGRLEEKGELAVVVRDQDNVRAFAATDGRPLWSFPDPQNRPLPEEIPSLWLVRHQDKPAVCFSTFGKAPPELILLDSRGQQVQRRSFPGEGTLLQVPLGSGDLDGSGREGIVVAAEGRVWASRGGIRPADEVWSWSVPAALRGNLSLLGIRARPGQEAEVMVRLRQGAVLGLRGSDGKVLWRNQAESEAFLLPGGAAEWPLLVALQPERETVCRVPLPAAENGVYRLGEGEAQEGPWQPPADDPRRLRPLPWTELVIGDTIPLSVLLGALGLALVVLIVPMKLLGRALRLRSRGAILAAIAWPAGLVLTGWLAGPSAWLQLRGAEAVLRSGTSAVLSFAVLFTLLGLPLLVLAWALLAAAAGLRWRRLLGLFLLLVLGGMLAAVVCLVIDRPGLDPEQHYSSEGWQHIWLLAWFAAGVCLLLGRFGYAAFRVLRSVLRLLRGGTR